MRVVAISGKMKSGKTSLATFLDRKFPRDVKLIHFAGKLKDDLQRMGFPRHDLDVTKPAIIRQLMQVYGQARRFYTPDYWAKALRTGLLHIASADAYYGRDTLVIVDDLRFPNELAMLNEIGAHTIRLIKTDDPDGPSPHADDVSETALDDAEFDTEIIASHGQLTELCSNALQFLVAKGVVGG